ncbi:MAG: Mce-associated rane protein [Streptomyces sp.]|jgi:Mce-associated membrane protein|nr:Mce-associated rane protein [Streptomyces sp.]
MVTNMAAAARAAAKRVERAELVEPVKPAGPAGRVVHVYPVQDEASAPARPRLGLRPRPRPRIPVRIRAGALALLLVGGLVAATFLGLAYHDAERTGQARTQAVAAARNAAPVILSYDYRHLGRDFTAARTHLTGTFRDTYARTTRTVVTPTATKYQGVVTATVAAGPAVVSATPDKVVVLVFVNQVTDSTRLAAPRLDLNRVRMTLTRTAGGWKVSAVDAL